MSGRVGRTFVKQFSNNPHSPTLTYTHTTMTTIEIQDFIHVYSMFSFKDGRKEPGIIINKYNLEKAEVEFFFIPQDQMNAYKNAFDRYDKETCRRLSQHVEVDQIINIRPVSLADYKVIMQLLAERNQRLSFQ